ncbi:MAG TPA: RNA-binding protein [Allocoleopsis sp.]
MSVRLYVGNLPKEVLNREELQTLFTDGQAITTKIIKDRKSGQCRGFAFVTVKNEEHADEFIAKFNGYLYKESPLKIEKALPRTKGGKDGDDEGDMPETSTPAVILPSQNPTPVPIQMPVRSGEGGNTNSSSGGGKKRSSKKRRDRQQKDRTTTFIQQEHDFQPDPRWATQLAQLKEMLSAANV